MQSEKSGDFRRPHIERQLVEDVFRVKLRGDAVIPAQAYLLGRSEIAIPAVRASHAKHGRQILIVGDQHPALDGRHVVRDEE